MTTSLPVLSYFSGKNLPVGEEGGSSPTAADRPKPTVYNSNITGSGADHRSQLTAVRNKKVYDHNRHVAEERANEDSANDKGGPRECRTEEKLSYIYVISRQHHQRRVASARLWQGSDPDDD
ncbi:hypothetical protein E5D57_000232 [Metarhizium anisopliae]|nr:hypothetical protein E5D57_000232 [Metarhizium anisopliae]